MISFLVFFISTVLLPVINLIQVLMLMLMFQFHFDFHLKELLPSTMTMMMMMMLTMINECPWKNFLVMLEYEMYIR
mgnify:CR=1 FL=1